MSSRSVGYAGPARGRAGVAELSASAARHALALAGVVVLALVVGAELVRQPSMIRLLTAACIGLLAFVGAAQWPERTVVATLLLLPFLALTRRLLLEFTGWQSTDPLLLVAPAVLGLILIRLFVFERRELVQERTSKLLLVVMAITLLQVAQPPRQRPGRRRRGLAVHRRATGLVLRRTRARDPARDAHRVRRTCRRRLHRRRLRAQSDLERPAVVGCWNGSARQAMRLSTSAT